MTEAMIHLVVTAARTAQRRVYEALLRERERVGDLPIGLQWSVVSDPRGRRVGSGAATALALLHVVKRLPGTTIASRLRGQRVFIIHSGGDSRRLPAFAALGKAFAPVPSRRASGSPATIFDLVLADLAALPPSREGDVIVASGDAVVGAGREGITLGGAGVVGIAQRGTTARGSRHGVYVADHNGRVREFLQKPTARASRSAGAVGRDGTLLIDTGIVRFDPRAAEALLVGFGVDASVRRVSSRGLLALASRGASGPIDLYDHVLAAFVPGRSSAAYRAKYPEQPDAIAALRGACAGVPFNVRVSAGKGFLHIGTTRECLTLLLNDVHTSREFGLELPTSRVRQLGCAAISYRMNGMPRGARAVTIGSVDVSLCCAGDNLVVGVPPGVGEIALRKGWGVVCLPIGRRQWATVLFHRDDDGKTAFASGGSLGGVRLARWCARRKLDPSIVGSAATLWEAPLWMVTSKPAIPMWMMDGSPAPTAWRRGKRSSIAELLDRVNPERLVALERLIAQRAIADDPLAAFRNDDLLSATALVQRTEPSKRRALARRLIDAATTAEPLAKARVLAVASRLLRERWASKSRSVLRAALTSVGEAVATDVVFADRPPVAAIRTDETAWTSAPARIDLAGGWSDTPPICHERGGAVVNLAIDLDGRPPVHAIAKLADEPVITLHSVDLGLSRTFRTSSELFTHGDPRDWTALAKAALRLSGIAPPSPRVPLRRWLHDFGGGLSLSMLAAVPKGSGLGTSSILGATVLSCLDRVTGRVSTREDLIDRTSALEQMISTRGGWQDQVGGIEPGCKIARTLPGARQVPLVEHIEISPQFAIELTERAVLCFTGLRRMARDILERVVERYLARDPGVLDTIARLRDNAERMRGALSDGDMEAFAAELATYWRLKTTLDPAAATSAIRSMAAPFERSLSAWTLPGAGGGGFLFLIARSSRHARLIRERLRTSPPHPLARSVDWSIASRGLRCGGV